MKRSSALFFAIALACSAARLEARQSPPNAALAVRDPDRGLDEKFRARLALADPRNDTYEAECWAASIDERLDELSARWAAQQLDPDLAEAPWIARDLRVAPLFDAPNPAIDGSWLESRRDASRSADAPSDTLAHALAAWRRCFRGESRLDFEVTDFEGEASRLEASVRVTASGPGGGARLQHNAVWKCLWRLDAGSAELFALSVEEFDAVALGPDERGQFRDVTESLFENPSVYRERLAPGLGHWRRVLPATVFPGILGHHGLAIGDVDGDGLEDVYLCRPGGLPNELLLHTRENELADATRTSGADLLDYSSSALLVDLDADGDVDLVVSTGTGLVFFSNDGAGHFERKLLLERSLATSMAAADFDGDGDVDLYVCSYLSPYEKNGMPLPYHDANNGEANMLLRNDGAWNFVDVANDVGLGENNERFSLAAAWEDYDDDGDLDVYVANDFGRNNLYRNDGGHFRDVARELGVEDVSAGMGVTWGDFDGDGRIDLYVTNMQSPAGSRLTSRSDFRIGSPPEIRAAYRHHALGNSLFANRGGGAFEDVTLASGTAAGRWGWGSIFVDFDDDGALDLFAPNGFMSGEREPDLDSFFWRQAVLQSPDGPGGDAESYSLGWRAVNRLSRQGFSWNGHERNVAFWNVGHGRFADVSSAIGLDQPDDSRAAARLDWDGDGDEDLIVTNRSGPMLRVLENRQATGNAWIAFDLRERDPRHTSIGSRVVLETTDGRQLVRTLQCGEGYFAQQTSRVHFGLGRAGVRNVRVRWPSGDFEEFGSPAARSVYRIERGTHEARALPPRNVRARAAAGPAATANDEPPARAVLPTPLPLPRMVLQTWDGKPASLLGITIQGPQGTGQPLVLLLWSSDDAASRRQLERIAAKADTLRDAGIKQILGLSVDASEAARANAVAGWKETGWPFARAFLSEESLSVLEIVENTLHDDARGLRLPAAFLVDAGGRLVATYTGNFEPEQLRDDLRLFDLAPEARRDASVPFPGRWVGGLPQPLDGDVVVRLLAHGLERPAAEYELARVEVRESSAASFEYEVGVARQRQGRLPDAIQHYRRALELDPTYVIAAQTLAIALHQHGDHAAALAAYKEALKLDPAHEGTRCNLGYLHIAMGNIAGAESELRALRQLHSALADTLEEHLRASGLK